ncbi:MAG: hypothetical protein LBO00_03460 [Zoogloeaceae bacterium]|nr:hypothetical protein [Zoogloeaceae bacterium]
MKTMRLVILPPLLLLCGACGIKGSLDQPPGPVAPPVLERFSHETATPPEIANTPVAQK